MTVSTDIAEKVTELRQFFADHQKHGAKYEAEEVRSEDIEVHRVDWSRLGGVDDGHLWRFPPTGLCRYRLTVEEIANHLPSPFDLLRVWRKTTLTRDIPEASHNIPLHSCTDTQIIRYLSTSEFKTLSPLHTQRYLVPNDRYLSFLLWGILDERLRDTVTKGLYTGPGQVTDKFKALRDNNENPYWAVTDVTRFPFVPPIVCAADYPSHPWKEAFYPTEQDTRSEAQWQLSTLETFKKFRLSKPRQVGLWDGYKDFTFVDPHNYLELSHKAPPAILFRTDQAKRFTRESVEKGSCNPSRGVFESLNSNLYEDADRAAWRVSFGPGTLPETDWEAEQEVLGQDQVLPEVPTSSGKGSQALEAFKESRTSEQVLPEVEMSDAHATPKGVPIPILEVTMSDVTITHRDPQKSINRPIFTGTNGGSAFKNAQSSQRADYREYPAWPIVNSFPSQDVCLEPSREDVIKHCGHFTVLPDFWKYHIMRLKIDKRGDYWKLDFNKQGFIAGNFVSHGAAATMKDRDGKLRFVVWNQYQLHGDIGARLGLGRKMSKEAWDQVLGTTPPGAVKMSENGKHAQYMALGDLCPPTYQFPPDWDVLGILPPLKKPKLSDPSSAVPRNLISSGLASANAPSNSSGFASANAPSNFPGFASANAPSNFPGLKPEDGPAVSRLTSGNGPSATSIARQIVQSRESSTTTPVPEESRGLEGLKAPKYPKARILMSKKVSNAAVENAQLSLENAQLSQENARLRSVIEFADAKVKALTVFGAHQDGVVALLAQSFASLNLDDTTHAQIQQAVDTAIQASDSAVVTLASEFPSMESLVSSHDDDETLETTTELRQWLKQEDHIESGEIGRSDSG